jgi:hypothetical protein
VRGADPKRYEFGNSPYVGARYDSCADVIKVYYGGYVAGSFTHYNVRRALASIPFRGGQSELQEGPARVWTIAPLDPYFEEFTVQGCVRGKFPRPSSCTRWSPTVRVSTHGAGPVSATRSAR